MQRELERRANVLRRNWMLWGGKRPTWLSWLFAFQSPVMFAFGRYLLKEFLMRTANREQRIPNFVCFEGMNGIYQDGFKGRKAKS